MVTVVDRGDKEAGLRAFGADHFIDYTRSDFTQGSNRFDVIFDMVPGTSYRACQRLLNKGGHYLCGNPRLSTMLRTPFTNRFSDRKASFAFAPETKQALSELAAMIDAGSLKGIVDSTYPLERAADAHRQVEAEDRVGAVVIEIDGSPD